LGLSKGLHLQVGVWWRNGGERSHIHLLDDALRAPLLLEACGVRAQMSGVREQEKGRRVQGKGYGVQGVGYRAKGTRCRV
jgi:hypothetical protein